MPNAPAVSSLGAFEGRPLAGRAFHRAMSELEDPDLAEAAWVFQHAIFIGAGRTHDWERVPRAELFAPVMGNACHTFSPERVGRADRVRGSARDFSDRPEAIFDRDRAPGTRPD